MLSSNPLKSPNPCALARPSGTVKTRGITAYDLLKEQPTLKVKRTQSEVQECCRPSFDHPKILHILIDRANGVGAKTLAKGHGGSTSSISKFCQSMGFGVIKPKDRIDMVGRELKAYEREWMKEVRSTSKDVTWASHPVVVNWKAMKKYYTNPKAHNRKCEEWKSRNRGKVRDSRAKWKPGYFKRNPSARIADTLRSRLINAINAQQAGKKVSAVKDLGCSIEFFIQYIETRFHEGMTWENRGVHGWHFDHIKPCASFDLTKKSEQKKCFHYTNYQPMWADDNIRKSDKQDEQLKLL